MNDLLVFFKKEFKKKGIAHGVGTAKILGRIHSAPLKLGNLFLPCSFTVMESMESKGVEFLLGLDMLKRHQACIDLAKNVLRISTEEVAFLPEHEIPGHLKEDDAPKATPTTAASKPQAPVSTTAGTSSQATASGNAQKFPEASIQMLMNLGVSRPEAIVALEACNGNADLAANMLFQ
jgi:DNA damage-inducible protein 1